MKKEMMIKYIIRDTIKKLFPYFFTVILGVIAYIHEYIPSFSEDYYTAKKYFLIEKDSTSIAFSELREFVSETKQGKKYEEARYKKQIAFNNFQSIKKQNKFFGFKSMHFFMDRFGFVLVVFIYSLFNLFTSFYLNRQNIGVKVIHGFIISVCLFYFFWIFQSFQDFNKVTYYLATIISAVAVTIGVYYITKYRKTIIQRLEKQNINALSTIEELENEVLTKQEEQRTKERQRISEELHDGVLGKLFGARIGLGFLDVLNEKSKDKLHFFLNELQEIEKEIRDVSHKLNVNLDGSDIGFVAILEQLLKDKSVIGGFTYTLDIITVIDWEAINEVDRVNLYRIIQEGLQNVIKHSKAESVIVVIEKRDNILNIEVEDNGVGFNTFKFKKGIGISNIKSRVKRLKGSIVINSVLNKGTSLRIRIPYIKELEIS